MKRIFPFGELAMQERDGVLILWSACDNIVREPLVGFLSTPAYQSGAAERPYLVRDPGGQYPC